MKKQLLLFILMLLPMIASARAVEIDGIYYNLDNQTKTAEVTYHPNKLTGSRYSGQIVIPNTVVYEGTTYNVTSIGSDAFGYDTDVTSVTIPNSVTSIGNLAFSGCGLSSVTIPGSVISMGKNAFSYCKSLTSLSILDGVTSIGEKAFEGCSGLTTIIIPNSVISIGDYAFFMCKLKTITISANVNSIGEGAFNCLDSNPQDVFCLSLTPPLLADTYTFSSTTKSTIYVYNQAVDAYKSVDNWAKYKIFGLGSEDMADFSVNGFHYGDGINNYLSCGITSISKVGSTIGSASYVQKTFAMFISNKHTDAISIMKVVAKDSSTDEVLATLDDASKLGELKGGETKEFSITIRKDVDPVYEVYYTYKDRLCLFNTKATDKRQFDLTIQSTGNGKVTCEGKTAQNGSVALKVDGGTSYTVTITPDNGYSIESVTVNKNDVTAKVVNGQYTVKISSNTDISVKFKVNKYKLTYTVDGNVYKAYDIEYGAKITPEAAPTKEGYTFSGWSSIPATMPAKDVTVTGSFTINKYKLTYMVDGAVYKTVTYEYGARITPEAAPMKEGFTFSGWSNIPSTMPANDVTVTGTFSRGSFTLTYVVDGVTYKTVSYNYGETIIPEAAPTKEGYTFSGWSYIPSTMPAENVTVTGTFTVNKYTLTYKVDGAVYKTVTYEYGARITPEAAPTKEGYAFSGWSSIPSTMPAKDVTVTGSFTINKYKLTYKVDGAVYKTVTYEYGARITPEAAPTKEGYTFSGWSYIPSTMPAEDVTVTGMFTVNKYKLTYMVDGVEYKSYILEYGTTITPETEPTKEGYTFSGWSEIPQTMPAYDVTITGTFTKGSYKLIYKIDGEVYKTVSYDYGATITPEADPSKEGYTFSGWSEIPKTMPDHDVTVTGTFTINKYKLIYKVDGEVYKSYEIEYGATITPEAEPTKEGYKFSGWSYIPSKMPAEDVTVVGTFTQEAAVKDNVSYEIDGDNASVTHADNAKGEIKIEASVVINGKTYSVTAIADGAFQGCAGLTSVEIPNTITSIGKNAFDGCSGLILIKIGKGIKEIGSKAFANIGSSKVRTRAEDITLKVYCEAETLPYAAADVFENTPIDEATLYVLDALVDVYKFVVPWDGFGSVVGLSTSIRNVTVDSEDDLIFDMQGNRLDNVRKGINIIRTKDGKTKKMMTK